MNVEDATDTIAKFFNDFIGAWVPGAVLAVGLALMHIDPAQLRSIFTLEGTISTVLIFAGILFALGHVLLALYEQVLVKGFAGLEQVLEKRFPRVAQCLRLKMWLLMIGLVGSFEEAEEKERQSYKWFEAIVKAEQSGGGDWAYNDLCSIALSVSAEAASIGRRFMFIAVLCRGVGTALFIITLDFLLCSLRSPKLLFHYDLAAHWAIQAAFLFVVVFALFKQGDSFYTRAKTTPFAIAVAELRVKKDANAGKATPPP